MLRRMLWAALLGALCAASLAARDLTLHVSPAGHDAWSGRPAAPTRAGGDGPLATVHAALEAARAWRAQSPGHDGTVRIRLQGGLHPLDQPIVLGPEDSGLGPRAPLILESQPGEEATLSGGRPLVGWKASTRFPGAWEAPVPQLRGAPWVFRQLFVEGRRAVRSRLPNLGYLQFDGDFTSVQPAAFRYRAGEWNPAWAAQPGLEVIGLHKWVDFRQPVKTMDPATRTVTLAGNVAEHTREANTRYYLENFPDGFDASGEWYLDAAAATVYYRPLPGESPEASRIIAPALSNGLIRFAGRPSEGRFVRHVVIRNLGLAHTDWTLPANGYTDVQAAVHIRGDLFAEGAVDCAIERCRFSQLAGYGIELGRGCQRWRIVANELVDLGAGGIRLGEGTIRSEAADQNRDHRVTDNHLHQLGRIYAPAVGLFIQQSGGNHVAHNHVHDLFYTAVSVGWNWGYQETPCRSNIVEFKHLHHIGQGILSDMGAVYTLGIQPGTAIRNNLIHDVTSHSYGGWGLYPDEGSTGIVWENNVVYRTKSAGFHQHYGRENIVRNNIFAFGREYQLMRSREESHLSFFFTRNIVYFDSGELLGSNWSNHQFRMDHNLYFDARPGASPDRVRFKGKSLAEWQQAGHDRGSRIADPRFVDPDRHDFRLRRDSPARALGFRPIDLRPVGVRPEFKSAVRDTDP